MVQMTAIRHDIVGIFSAILLPGLIPWHSVGQSMIAAGMAFGCCILLGPAAIRILRSSFRERIASDSARLNELHASKQQTPTMGGLLILLSFTAGVLPHLDFSKLFGWILMISTWSLVGVGATDDWIKLRISRKGLTVRQKLLAQIVIAFVTAVGLNQLRSPVLLSTTLLSWLPESTGWLFIPWAMFVIVATSNAVNLTDGLDGLASGCTVMSALTMTVLVILISGSQPGNVPSREAMAGFAALCGAVLGFLWFNRHPAKVFMGDAGSLPIGGMLAVLSLACQMELLLLLTAAVFVAETLSVMLQVGWYRRTGRRILLCSPLHNHFVFKGIPERRIVRGFWAAAGFFCITAVLLVWIM